MKNSVRVQLTKAVKGYLADHGKMTVGELDGLIYTIYGESQLVRLASHKGQKVARKVKNGQSVTEEELLCLVGLGVKQMRSNFLYRCKNSKNPWLVRKENEIWLANNGDMPAV